MPAQHPTSQRRRKLIDSAFRGLEVASRSIGAVLGVLSSHHSSAIDVASSADRENPRQQNLPASNVGDHERLEAAERLRKSGRTTNGGH